MKPAWFVIAFLSLAVVLVATPCPTYAQSTYPGRPGVQSNYSGPTYPKICQQMPHTEGWEFCNLAQRFAPYEKFPWDVTTCGSPENHNPCSYAWLLGDSTLWSNFNSDNGGPPRMLLVNPPLSPDSLLTYETNGDIRTTDPANNPFLDLIPSSKWGEDWPTVAKAGDGIYAHVEEVNDGTHDLVNIEYWILYSWNQGLCSGFCTVLGTMDHYGDITVVALVYCRSCDQIVHASFVRHGFLIDDYDLTSSPQLLPATLTGLDPLDPKLLTDPSHTNQVSVAARNLYQLQTFYESRGCKGGRWPDHSCVQDFHTACLGAEGFAQVYFVQDPDTQLFDHIAVYHEQGNHEPWPAPCGSDICVANHNGAGPSFFAKPYYLGTMFDMSQRDYPDAPFIFWNGKWGSDPQPPALHNEWYYPLYRGMFASRASDTPAFNYLPPNDNSRYVDKDPYSNWACVHHDYGYRGPDDDDCYGQGAVNWPPSAGVCITSLRPPKTALEISGPAYENIANEGTVYITGSTSISLSVTDVPSGAGSASPHYLVSPAAATPPAGGTVPPFVLASGPFTLSPPDGTYNVYYYSIDAWKNQEWIKSSEFTLDTTPPAVTITQPTATNYPNYGLLTLSYSVSDGQGSGVKSVTPKMDGATTVSGHSLLSGQSLNLAELSVGMHTFSLDSVDNVGNASLTQSVTFSIIRPTVSVSPSSLSFGNQLVGILSAQFVTLQNSSISTLNITNVVASGDFTVKSLCGTGVLPNTNCAVEVDFRPTAGGPRTGLLTIQDDASSSPQTVSLSGIGQDFSIGVASGGSTSATVSPGQSATFNLSFAPIAGLAGTIMLACNGAPAQADCVISPITFALNGSSASTAQVTVTTTAASGVLRDSYRSPLVPGGRLLALSVWFWASLFAALTLAFGRRGGRHKLELVRVNFGIALLFMMLTGAITMLGCSPGPGNNVVHSPGTPAGTYNLTVMATITSGSATLTHNIALTLNVK